MLKTYPKTKPLNQAQLLLHSMGFDPVLLIAFTRGPNFSHTKKGPGRKHKQGWSGE